MNNERIIKWLAAIAGFLLVSTVSLVGWIAMKVWDMNPIVTMTAQRVDKIVEVLPDMRVRLAGEDLDRKFTSVILTTEPVQSSKGTWKASVHHLDFEKGIRRTYVTTLKGPEDHLTSTMVTGLATRTARDKLSLDDFEIASKLTSKPTEIPMIFNSDSSYAIFRATRNVDKGLRHLFGEPKYEGALQKGQLKYEELAKQLHSQVEVLRPPED